ncbi:FecR family protein [Prolixibacter sp. SD074]|jgi:ferric-dicitrate binding protein FerR (iron transport regulator)|uniref:FecR family protein n=1 Tax=Prolixibacter sp. SD074 TaxID=2652391 RepID=UPI001298F3B3|nr:FecR domain-containing protein [Prolixibacter sp. SD074]
MQKEDKNREIAAFVERRECMDTQEQVSEAVNVIDLIDHVDVPGAFFKVSNRLPGDDKWRFYLRRLSNVAAILFLPILLFAIWQYYFPHGDISGDHIAMQQISSPPGTRSQIVLPDGSKVWLNAESTIRFPIPFSRKTRNVSLVGQAFFSVQKTPEVPFIVKADNVQVKVLGTEFDVNAYPDMTKVGVVLARGKISLTTQNQDHTSSKSVILHPGERAVVGRQSGEVQLSKGDINKYIAWHNGRLVFDETPMKEVARQLELWYGIKVIIKDPEILNYHFSTTFENESLYQVLELLKLSSPIDIDYQNAHYDRGEKSYTKSIVYIKKKTK